MPSRAGARGPLSPNRYRFCDKRTARVSFDSGAGADLSIVKPALRWPYPAFSSERPVALSFTATDFVAPAAIEKLAWPIFTLCPCLPGVLATIVSVPEHDAVPAHDSLIAPAPFGLIEIAEPASAIVAVGVVVIEATVPPAGTG